MALGFDLQQIGSLVYFVAAAALIFIAALLAGKNVQRQLPIKWIAGIAAVALVTVTLIWLLLALFSGGKSPAPQTAPDYSTPVATP